LRTRLDVSATEYLCRLDGRHQALGYGAMATRREKITRWESGASPPEITAQLAMADLHGVPRDAVLQMGRPHWLLLAFPDDRAVLDSPWTPAGSVASMTASARGASMDGREFLIAAGATVSTIAGNWAGLRVDPGLSRRRRPCPCRASAVSSQQQATRRRGDRRRVDEPRPLVSTGAICP
jgi:hypothetical protein